MTLFRVVRGEGLSGISADSLLACCQSGALSGISADGLVACCQSGALSSSPASLQTAL